MSAFSAPSRQAEKESDDSKVTKEQNPTSDQVSAPARSRVILVRLGESGGCGDDGTGEDYALPEEVYRNWVKKNKKALDRRDIGCRPDPQYTVNDQFTHPRREFTKWDVVNFVYVCAGCWYGPREWDSDCWGDESDDAE
jgi:hypothetical protein